MWLLHEQDEADAEGFGRLYERLKAFGKAFLPIHDTPLPFTEAVRSAGVLDKNGRSFRKKPLAGTVCSLLRPSRRQVESEPHGDQAKLVETAPALDTEPSLIYVLVQQLAGTFRDAVAHGSVVLLDGEHDVEADAVHQATSVSLPSPGPRSEEHTSELQSRQYLVCRLLLEKKKC